MGLKNKILNSVISPNNSVNNLRRSMAQVIETDEVNNNCTINMINEENKSVKCSNVPVRIYDPAIVGSFPRKGDIVEIEINNGFTEIVSICNYSYGINIKKDFELKKDIYHTNYNNIAGYIF